MGLLSPWSWVRVPPLPPTLSDGRGLPRLRGARAAADVDTIARVPRAFRLVLAAFGVLVAVYAAAGLTGSVKPPWWEREEVQKHRVVERLPPPAVGMSSSTLISRRVSSVEHRELISIAVGAVGLAALAFSAWPRRTRANV